MEGIIPPIIPPSGMMAGRPANHPAGRPAGNHPTKWDDGATWWDDGGLYHPSSHLKQQYDEYAKCAKLGGRGEGGRQAKRKKAKCGFVKIIH